MAKNKLFYNFSNGLHYNITLQGHRTDSDSMYQCGLYF